MSTINVDNINEYTSGDGVTVDGVLIKDGVVAGKAVEADQYQINSDISSDSIPITTLVRPTGTLQAYPGTGMSQSSGTWTFPSTGYYEVFIYGRIKPTG